MFSYLENPFGSAVTIKEKTKAYAQVAPQLEAGADAAKKFIKETNDLDLAIIEYAKQCNYAGMSTQGFTEFLKQNSIWTKASQLGWQALAVAGNMLASIAISAVVQGFYQLITLSHTVANGASEAANAFGTAEKDIAGYRKQIDDLYKVINDSGSSVEQVTSARESLLQVQDEMIEKFGTEAGAIDIVTQAIHNQTGALDELTSKSWTEALNSFNEKGGFVRKLANSFGYGGYHSNVERMQGEYGRADTSIVTGMFSGFVKDKEQYQRFLDIVKSLGAELGTNDYGDEIIKIKGNADEVYNTLLDIQNVAKDMQLPDKVSDTFGTYASKAKEARDEYKAFYEQYTRQEKILSTSGKEAGYDDIYKSLVDQKAKIDEAFKAGDDEAREEAIQEYASILSDAMAKAANDEDVKDYFHNMYPEIQSEVDTWRFKIKFEANADDLKSNVQADITKFTDKGYTAEDILAYNPTKSTDVELNDAYNSMTEEMKKFNLEVKDGIPLLEEWGMVKSRTFAEVQKKFGLADDFDELNQKIKDAEDNLKSEYGKIDDWGLSEYADKIKDGTIQTKFGNVDMDKRTIIEWSDELKKTYADALASWNYDPEIGGIDTVFGGSDRLGEKLNGLGWEVAFTPILPNGEFLSKDTVYEYLEQILAEAYADDGKVTDAELKKLDAEGRMIGNTFVQGIYAGVDDSLNYDNNGNKADVIGRLMHFSGDGGAIAIGKQKLEEYQKELENQQYIVDNLDLAAKVDPKNINSIEDLVAAIKELQKVESEKPLSKSEMITQINGMSKGFEELDKIMASIVDKDKAFDFSLLDDKDFKETFGTLGQEYDNFVETISNSPKDINACQGAFNDLVSKWIQSLGVLDQVNEGNASLTAAMLKNMGVTNSDALVQQALAHNLRNVQAEEDYAALTSKDLTDATIEEVIALGSESGVLDSTKQNIAQYKLAKIAANGITLDTSADISNLMSLVKMCGGAVTALEALYNAKQGAFQALQDNLSSSFAGLDVLSADPIARAEAQKKANEYKKQNQAELTQLYARSIQDINAVLNADYKVDAEVGGGNKTKDKSNGGGSGSGSGSEKDPTEFDWIERKLNVLNDQIDRTKSNIEELVGYKSKNAETDTALDLMTKKLGVLQDMHKAYMNEADKIGLSDDYIDKIKNGGLDIEKISDENVAKQVKNYQDLYDKAQDCEDQIKEVTKSIKEMNLSELDNIIDQFSQTIDVLSKPIDTQLQILDWHKASDTMEVVADDYIALGEAQMQIAQENQNAYDQLSEKMKGLNLEEGSEEWKKYNDQLIEYKNNMVAAAQAVEDYKDQMKELVYKELTDYKSKMDSINNTISTMTDLIGDTKLVDDTGNLTDRGLAQMALYAQQLANAKQEAAEYDEAIKSLDEALDSGLLTQDEYKEKLYDYKSSQESAVKATKDARDAIISLAKEGIQAEIDARKEQTDAAIEALEAEKDLHDYTDSINEKQKNITTLQKKIAALSGATSGAELAQRLQLEKDLADAQKDLYDTQYDHNIEQQKNALNDAYDAYEKEKNDEMDELDSNLAAQEKAIKKYLSEVKANYKTAYDVLTKYGDEYNVTAIEDLTTPWESGSNAANVCADAIGDAVANINYEISSIDISPLQELIEAMQQLADYGISGSGGGSGAFEDISDQGSWHKGSGGRWWFGDGDDYASDGVYTINGAQYGFGKDGYMMTGWNDESGDWRYFQEKGDDIGKMVKSDWVQDGKKKNWYYVGADGAMLTNKAVKDKKKDVYYYLDDDGKWDGKELTYEQIKKLGYSVGYRKGTKSSTPGVHSVGEDGPEFIISNNGTAMVTPNGGDMVFTKDMSCKLFDFSKNPVGFMDDLKKQTIADIPMINNAVTQSIPINVVVQGNADQNTINAMKGMLQTEMKKYATGSMFRDIQKAGRGYR